MSRTVGTVFSEFFLCACLLLQCLQEMSDIRQRALLVSLNERNRIVHFSGSSMSDLVIAVKEAFTDLHSLCFS